MTESNSLHGHEDGGPKPLSSVTPRRPDYNKLHACPLPLKIHPLPLLVPHNPLSLLYIAGTYIFQLIYPPSSHPPKNYAGYFSSETLSVHITDEVAIRTFWENGFFGKGSLSRSKPSWLLREKRRRGLIVGETSEEITRRRREARKEFKKERAKKERELIEQKLREEEYHDSIDKDTIAPELESTKTEEASVEPHSFYNSQAGHDSQASDVTAQDVARNNSSLSEMEKLPEHDVYSFQNDFEEAAIENQEHLQLSLEEAYFLAYALGVLDIFSPITQEAIPLPDLLPLFMSHSTFPPVNPSSVEAHPPDNSFLVNYVAYHHFRSLGWVVRSGIKFAVDLLLYNRGPVFSHAEFAVMVLPSYSHAFWVGKYREKQRPWHWLYMVNRVQTQVRKSLVLCYVEIPPPAEHDSAETLSVGSLLKRYKVREIILKRWVPNRSRD